MAIVHLAAEPLHAEKRAIGNHLAAEPLHAQKRAVGNAGLAFNSTGTVEPDVAPPLPIATTGAADGARPAPRDVSPDPASPSPGATAGARPAPAVPGRGTGRDGLISLIAPVPAQVFADGKLIGTMERGVFKLPVGPHDLELVNDEFGYRARQRVMVNPARTAQVRLAAPTGTLSINAVPWAEVWIDDTPAGQTPIGDFWCTDRSPAGGPSSSRVW